MTEEPSADRTGPKPLDEEAGWADLVVPTTVDKSPTTTRPYGPIASIALTILLVTVMGAVGGVVIVALQFGRGVARPGGVHRVEAPSDGLVLSVGPLPRNRFVQMGPDYGDPCLCGFLGGAPHSIRRLRDHHHRPHGAVPWRRPVQDGVTAALDPVARLQ